MNKNRAEEFLQRVDIGRLVVSSVTYYAVFSASFLECSILSFLMFPRGYFLTSEKGVQAIGSRPGVNVPGEDMWDN